VVRTSLFTLLALVAFASNSVLCRLALSRQAIDPVTFTAIRLLAGAITLAVIARARSNPPVGHTTGTWVAAGSLFVYALPFSLAYVSLPAGTGALLLFGAVQTTMMAAAIWRGEPLSMRRWIGLGAAIAGLIYLVLPGVSSPSLAGAALMLLAGVAWGLYSLAGRKTTDPIGQTATNFRLALPFAVLAWLLAMSSWHARADGVLLAVASGALASGIGYVCWYHALPALSRASASVVQLAVPPLAAVAGVLVLGEALSLRLGVATLLVIGGIATVLAGDRKGS
jgi:drug/metabolite transporter (DMT)-like permease